MFNNLTIKTRLTALIAFLSAMLILIGFLGLRGMGETNAGLKTVFEDRLVPSNQIAVINNLMAENVRQIHLASMHDPRIPESKLHDHPITMHTDRIKGNVQKVADIWKEYLASYLTPEEKLLAEEYAEKYKKFTQDGLLAGGEMFLGGDFPAANTHLVKVVGPAYLATRDMTEKLLQLQLRVSKEEFVESSTNYAITRNVAIGAIVVSVMLAALSGMLLIRAIGGSLRTAGDIAGRIAAGDLSSKIEIRQRDEIGQLLESMRAMQDSLAKVVAAVRQGSEAVSTASAEIASGNNDLSGRTEAQASALEETAASMEELGSTVKQNADNARQANQLAQSASTVAV
jgi:methyl-accepting chemotaxis protein-1 (serine sensor receptor)